MEPRVLILEDEKLPRKWLKLIINGIEAEKLSRFGINRFEIDTAGSAAEAYELLMKAVGEGRPYDVLLLDLSVPPGESKQEKSSGDPDEALWWMDKPEVGMDVLRYVKRENAVKEVIVYSAYPYYKFIAPAFRLGVLDFIAKSDDEKRTNDKESLQKAVLAAWERVLAKESARTLEQRFKTLVPYAEQVLTYQLGKYFSRLIQSVSHEVETMKLDLADRLGLDTEKDTHDPLLWHLFSIQKSVREARLDWNTLPQTRLGEEEDEILGEVIVEDELKKIVGDVLPCLTLKRAKADTPGSGSTRVISFAQDVPTILREIIVGGLGEAGERTESGLEKGGEEDWPSRIEDWPVRMNVRVNAADEKAEIRFEDNLLPIDPTAAESINKGLEMTRDSNFGRVWGLSIAQHAALRGGGRLVVEPSQEGNVISYFVPLKY